MPTFDGRQLTAARALAELNLNELGEAAGVTARTVHRLEIGGEQHIAQKRRHGHVSNYVWEKIVVALKHHGVELLPETHEHRRAVASSTRTATAELAAAPRETDAPYSLGRTL